MINKVVTTRKPHVCSICGGTIPTGSSALFFQTRTSYDGTLHYVTGWECLGECIVEIQEREARIASYLTDAQSDAKPQRCPYCGRTGTHRADCMSYLFTVPLGQEKHAHTQ